MLFSTADSAAVLWVLLVTIQGTYWWGQFVGTVTNTVQVLGSLGAAGAGTDVIPAQVRLVSRLDTTKDNLI